MSERSEEMRDSFGAGITVGSGVWYRTPRVELLATSAEGPRGGAPKTVQVLLSLDQAKVLCEQIAAAAAASSAESDS